MRSKPKSKLLPELYLTIPYNLVTFTELGLNMVTQSYSNYTFISHLTISRLQGLTKMTMYLYEGGEQDSFLQVTLDLQFTLLFLPH